MTISFTVQGVPIPQGSKTLVGVKSGHPRMINNNDHALKAWRTLIGEVARETGAKLIVGMPVELEVRFVFPRPGRPKCGEAPCVAPDVDKLLRAVGDAITGILIHDDALITDMIGRKRFGPPGRSGGTGMAMIMVRPATITWP